MSVKSLSSSTLPCTEVGMEAANMTLVLSGSGHQGAPELTATSRPCLVAVRGILGKEGRDFVRRNPRKVIRLSLCFPVMTGRTFCFPHAVGSTACHSGGPEEVVSVCPESSPVLSRDAWTIDLPLPPTCLPASLPALPPARIQIGCQTFSFLIFIFPPGRESVLRSCKLHNQLPT